MTVEAEALRIAVLSGAGGGAPDPLTFVATPSEAASFRPVLYPGWRRYVEDGFDAQGLIDDLADEIAGWGGRVAILGFSIGGHLGYAIALKLQSLGVDVAGFCAVDSFLVSSDAVRPGSTGRHLARLRKLARSGSAGGLPGQVRQLFWRALLRLAGARTASALRRWGDSGVVRAACAVDPKLEDEFNMRLLMRATAPWLRELDRHPAPLRVRAAHLRTAGAAGADAVWRARCPDIAIVEIPGDHDGLLDPENFAAMRRAFALATRGWR